MSEHYFTCPACGGHHFGRLVEKSAEGQPVALARVRCDDEHDHGCRWVGEWPRPPDAAFQRAIRRAIAGKPVDREGFTDEEWAKVQRVLLADEKHEAETFQREAARKVTLSVEAGQRPTLGELFAEAERDYANKDMKHAATAVRDKVRKLYGEEALGWRGEVGESEEITALRAELAAEREKADSLTAELGSEHRASAAKNAHRERLLATLAAAEDDRNAARAEAQRLGPKYTVSREQTRRAAVCDMGDGWHVFASGSYLHPDGEWRSFAHTFDCAAAATAALAAERKRCGVEPANTNSSEVSTKLVHEPEWMQAPDALADYPHPAPCGEPLDLTGATCPLCNCRTSELADALKKVAALESHVAEQRTTCEWQEGELVAFVRPLEAGGDCRENQTSARAAAAARREGATMMTPARLAEIQQRADAATAPPWEVSDTSIVSDKFCIAVIEDDGGYEAPERDENAEFLAHARTDIPDLLAHVAELAAENERLRGELKPLREVFHSIEHVNHAGRTYDGCSVVTVDYFALKRARAALTPDNTGG